MKGLIKKDFLLIKNNIKLIVVILFIFIVMSLQGSFDISFIVPFIVTMLFISTFSYDEYNKWDSYAVTLPNGRKNIVKSKYIASLILTVLSIIITIIISLIISKDITKTLETILGVFISIIIMESIMYPLIFKYGIEKGRICLFILIIILMSLLSFITKDNNVLKSITIFIDNYWYIFTILLPIVILFISYKISERIYLNKEF